jgi:hypothetical protein
MAYSSAPAIAHRRIIVSIAYFFFFQESTGIEGFKPQTPPLL